MKNLLKLKEMYEDGILEKEEYTSAIYTYYYDMDINDIMRNMYICIVANIIIKIFDKCKEKNATDR